MWEGANVLVAGGAGFIGASLIQRLLPTGCRLRATLNRRSPVIQGTNVEYVQADLTRMEDCRKAVEGVDYLFMCAASTSGAGAIHSTPLVHVTPNVVMNAQILEAAYSAGVKKFLWLSSNAGYPPTGHRPVREDEMFDGEPYATYIGPGWMKRYTEVLCRYYSENLDPPMPCVVLRPSNVYGPLDDYDPATSHVTAALVRKVIERRQPIEVWGTGEDVRDVIYIDDFVEALVLAMERVDTYDPINVAFGRGYRVREILDTLLEVDGYQDSEVICDPTKPSMIPVRLMDTSKATEILGFKADTSLEEGLSRTVEWYRKSRNLPRTGTKSASRGPANPGLS